MRRTFITCMLILGGSCFVTSARADVVIRGPFGGTIVISSPSDVRIGRGVILGAPARPPSFYSGPMVATAPVAGKIKTTEPPIVSTSRPVIRPESDVDELPLPKVLQPGMAVVPGTGAEPPVVAVSPRDFAKTFKPAAGRYEVVFAHPSTREPVTVGFELPEGKPRVSYVTNSLVFDYGRHEVEIRFKLGGKVVVSQR